MIKYLYCLFTFFYFIYLVIQFNHSEMPIELEEIRHKLIILFCILAFISFMIGVLMFLFLEV